MNFVDGIEIGGIHAYPGSPFGVPYSRADKVYDISADGSSVKLYLFSTDNGYDAVVRGNGAISNYLYTEATSTNSHTDDRPHDAETITRMYIEDGITSIGDYFMYKAFNLKNLTFANIGAITHLGTKAFAYTQIDGEYNFSGLTDTKLDCPFMACPKLQGVTFGGTITEIAVKSFQFCLALQYVKGLSFVTKIGDAAFQYCTELENIDVIPGNVTLGNWVFILTPKTATVEGTETALSNATWITANQCFVQNEWKDTAEGATTPDTYLESIRAVGKDVSSVQLPIPQMDIQKTEAYEQWMVFPAARNGKYAGMFQPASKSCCIFSLLHIYNIIYPNKQYHTFYDFITRAIEPRKIKFTQDLKDSIMAYPNGQDLINKNEDVYQVGNEITATDLLMSLDDYLKTWGKEGTAVWGVCEALGWKATEVLFADGKKSGETVKRAILDSLADGKPVMMEIMGAGSDDLDLDGTVDISGHGMHAVTAIGYDATTDRLLIIDSTWAFPAASVPFVFWCSFESLITPNEASAIWTFDFGEVVTMTDIDNTMKTLLERVNSGFHTESGTLQLENMTPASGAASVKVEIDCTNGAKGFLFVADNSTKEEINNDPSECVCSFMGAMYTSADKIGTGIKGVVNFWKDYTNAGYGYIVTPETTTCSNEKGFSFNARAVRAGTYHWTAYYWND